MFKKNFNKQIYHIFLFFKQIVDLYYKIWGSATNV